MMTYIGFCAECQKWQQVKWWDDGVIPTDHDWVPECMVCESRDIDKIEGSEPKQKKGEE